MLCAITATDGRPEAFALLVRWMDQQDFIGPLEWLIVGADHRGYDLPAAETLCRSRGWHFRHVMLAMGTPIGSAMIRNLRVAFDRLDPQVDRVIFCEDDDYIAPAFLSEYDALLSDFPLVGAPHARYYNVATRRFRVLPNSDHASLAQTGIRRELFPVVREGIDSHARPLQFDRAIWRSWVMDGGESLISGSLSPLHIAVKGMPGTSGYGVGHRPDFGSPDPLFEVARAWGLPGDYMDFHRPKGVV